MEGGKLLNKTLFFHERRKKVSPTLQVSKSKVFVGTLTKKINYIIYCGKKWICFKKSACWYTI